MKRKWPIPLLFVMMIPLVLIAIAVFSHQPPAADPFDPPDITPTPAPSDWITPGFVVQHVAVAPVNEKKVPLKQISLSRSQSGSLLKPMSDGGCLAISQDRVNEQDTSGNPESILRAVRFKPDGSVLWDRRYSSDPFSGYTVAACVWPDGGFAVSIRLSKIENGQYASIDRLFRFSPEGIKVWQTEDPMALSGAYEDLFAMTDGAVVTAGTIIKPDSNDRVTGNEVSLIRFEADGRLSARKAIGGAGYQMLVDAAFSEETGLILSWLSEPVNDPAKPGGSGQRRSMAGSFAADLHEVWTREMPDGMSVFNIQTLTEDGSVILSATKGTSTGTTPSGASQSMLLHINRQGSTDWTYAADNGAWFLNVAQIHDGRLIVGHHTGEYGTGERSSLLVLSGDGQFTKELAQSPGIVQQLVPTGDGGFTAIFRQSVRSIPQPPYISSLWVDSEAIAAHYDSALQLKWRRTIDQYKHELRTDHVVATVDDRLLVG